MNRYAAMHQGQERNRRNTAVDKPSRIIAIEPESELGRALGDATGDPVILVRGSARFRVVPALEDPWATYDPEKVRESLQEIAGIISPAEGERMKARIYRGREDGTRPLDRP